MSPQDIERAIESDPNSGATPSVPKAPTPAGLTGPSTPNYAGDALAAGSALKDFGIGALKGAGNTANNIGHILYPDWLAKHVTGAPSAEQQDSYFAPKNTTQSFGKGAEQVGEFLLPGGLEKTGAEKLATLAPKLGKFAAPVARTAMSALSTGAVNKAQGGSFGSGAAMGAGGGAVGEAFRAAAPVIAESALGIRGADRRAPITPGRAILDETRGTSARGIADQAKAKQTLYTGQRDTLLNAAQPVDLTPTRQIAKDAQSTAALRNNPETIKRTGDLSNLLTYEGGKVPPPTVAPPKVISGFGSAAATPPRVQSSLIPPQVSAARANDLKQGLGELKGSWNPAVPNDFADASVGRAYGSLDNSLEKVAPGQGKLNDKISGLFPVASRANATDLNASTLQRVLGRFTRPTGALVGASAGAGYGYSQDGLQGALLGGAAGLVAPEVIGSPRFQMGIARGANTGVSPVVRTLLGGGLQATRKNSLYGTK